MAVNEFLITDVVAQSALDQLKELSAQLSAVRATYADVAKELAKGITVKVDSFDGLTKKAGELEEAVRRVNAVEKELQQVQQAQAAQTSKLVQEMNKRVNTMNASMAATQKQAKAEKEGNAIRVETTNTISRELAAVERENATKREAYKIDEEALSIANDILGSYHNNIVRLGQLEAELKANAAERKALTEQEKQGILSTEEYAARRTELTARERELRQAKSELNKVLTNEEKMNQSAAGSYQALSLQLERMKNAYKQLNDEEKSSSTGEILGRSIQELDARLKDLSADMGEYQRNVGNYAVAGQSVRKEMGQLVQQVATLTVQYRALDEEQKNSPMGQEMAARIAQMTQEAAKLRDAMSDVNTEISKTASDTVILSGITEGINLLVSGTGALTAASNLLGISEEDLVKIQTNLQSVLVISNALTRVQNALQKQSAVRVGITALQTAAHTKAIALNTAAQSSNIIVSRAATVAQAAFNAVANANPYVLLATALVTVVGAISLFVKGTKDQTEAQQKLNELEKEHISYLQEQSTYITQVNKDNISGYEKELDLLKQRGGSYEEQRKLEQKILNERIKAYDKTGGLIQKEIKDYDENTKKLEIYRGALGTLYDMAENGEKKVMVDVELNGDPKKMKIEDAIKAMQDEADKYQAKVDLVVSYNNEGEDINDTQQRQEIEEQNRYKEAREKEVSILRNAEDAKIAVLKDGFTKQQMTLNASYARQIADLEKQLQTEENLTLKARYALNEQIAALRVRQSQELEQLERDDLANQLKLEQTNLNNRLDAIRGENEQELAERLRLQLELNESLRQSEILEAEKTGADTLAINEKYFNLAEDMEKENNEARLQLTMQGGEKRLLEIEKEADEEMLALKKSYANQEMDREDYEKAMYNISVKYSKLRLQVMIDELNRSLEENEGLLSPQQVNDIKERIDDLQRQLDNVTFDNFIKENERAEKETDASMNKIKSAISGAFSSMETPAIETASSFANLQKNLVDIATNFEKLHEELKGSGKKQWAAYAAVALQAISSITSSLSSLATFLFDAQIDALDEAIEANEEACDEETERIEALEESGAISAEEAEARKRAAEAKTAAKNKELEAEKAALEQKQAKYQKAADVTSATTATAVAIMQCYSQLGPIVGAIMAAVVAAVGAAEIATILATPLATYAEGTKDHPGGMAVVGDAGKEELVLTPEGKAYVTPDKPVLVELPKHTQVIPDLSYVYDRKGLHSDYGLLEKMMREGAVTVNVENDFTKLEKKMDGSVRQLRDISRHVRNSNRLADYHRIAARL